MKHQTKKIQGFVRDLTAIQDLHALRGFKVPRVMIRGEELSGNSAWEDWSQILQAFGKHPELSLEQWGKNGGDAYFESASVQIGWRRDKIYLLVTMEEQSVVAPAQYRDEQLWEYSDVVEIFFQAPALSECYQLQISPNGGALQLSYSDAIAMAALRHASITKLSNCLIRDPIFTIRSQMEDKKWRIFIEIPGRVLFSDDNSLLGRACWISVCRHDHWTDARPPCRSSTSPHFKTEFHEQKDWGLVDFVNARPRTNGI